MDYSLYKIIDIDVPLSNHVLTIQRAHVIMLYEQFFIEEVATAQLPCASDINI